ncbi:hypothetical protein ACH492_26165 [Streptomyces sp. NPDC019443]
MADMDAPGAHQCSTGGVQVAVTTELLRGWITSSSASSAFSARASAA